MADSESERSSFTFVMVVAWTFLNINLLCCGFVLYQTYEEWRKGGYKPLSMTHRLPFYNAVTNLILYAVFGVNIFYPAINLSLWPDPACQLLGFAGVFVICLNMLLIMIIAVAAYFRTRHGKIFDFGYKDYKLFSIITLLSLGLTLPGYFFEAYGNNTFWCVNHKDNYIGSYVAISVLLCVLTIVILCYVLLLLSLPHVDGELSEDQVNRSITAYILVSIFQSALLTAYYIYNLSNDQQQLLNFIVLGITININGIGCAVYYGINKYYTKRNNPPPLPKRSRRSRLSTQSSKSSGSRRSRKRGSKVVSVGSALEVVYEEPVFIEVVNDGVDLSEMSENTEESSWPD